MQKAEGHYFYIFNWQEEHITDWNNISNNECNIAGNILGRIHAINPKNVSCKEPGLSAINWHGYIHKAEEEKSKIASLLSGNVQLLEYAVKELDKARASLPGIECSGYGNPVSHVLQMALQWSGIVTCNIDFEKMAAFFDGYFEAYDNCFRAYSSVFGLAYIWAEWLEYNIQRALGTSIDETERMAYISEIKNTIRRIKYIKDNEKEIKDVLNSRLHKIDAARYDNNDGRICYYELLLEGDITGIPQYGLPDGYRFVTYTGNDRDAWIDIEMSAREFTTYEQGLDAWNYYYAARIDELPGRMFFIETNEGGKIATATALYNIYGQDKSNDGWLHWVAVKREYQGKGLSKPLITYVLRMMNKLGYVHAKIPTQTNTWLACKVYMDLGFLPVKKNMERNYEGWNIIKALTGHSVLQHFKPY